MIGLPLKLSTIISLVTFHSASDGKRVSLNGLMISTFSFEFSTFSEDTYSYFSSLGEHRDKGELGIFGGEVIPVYSNVYNGLGVLISVNSQQFFVKPTQ